LLVIALNKIRAAEVYHRAGKRDVRATTTADRLDDSVENASRASMENDPYLHVVVTEALERLDEPLRQAVELRLHGYEVREIAERTGRPLRTVERLLQEARAELKQLLGAAG
jgi:RNA polymerase sigma factor (sigma-70 family)